MAPKDPASATGERAPLFGQQTPEGAMALQEEVLDAYGGKNDDLSRP